MDQQLAATAFQWSDSDYNTFCDTYIQSDLPSIAVLDIGVWDGTAIGNPDWAAARQRCGKNGAPIVLGYVPSFGYNSALGPLDKVPEMVNLWYENCPEVDSIFFDQGPACYMVGKPPDCILSDDLKNYYRGLYA